MRKLKRSPYKTAFSLQDSPKRRSTGVMSYTDTLDADDDDAFGDTIQDTLTLSDSAQLREDAKFHEMNRYSSVLTLLQCPHW